MGNLEIGPKDWPNYWVLIQDGKTWSAAAIFTSEEAAFREVRRLIAEEIRQSLEEEEPWDEGYLKRLQELLADGSAKDLMDEWHEHGGTLYTVQQVAMNKPVDPEEWFDAGQYPGQAER